MLEEPEANVAIPVPASPATPLLGAAAMTPSLFLASTPEFRPSTHPIHRPSELRTPAQAALLSAAELSKEHR